MLALQRALAEAEDLARAYGFAVSENGAAGTVIDVHLPTVTDPGQAQEVHRDRARVQAEVVDRLEQLLRRAEDVDADYTAGRRAARSTTAPGPRSPRRRTPVPGPVGCPTIGPPREGTPADNAGLVGGTVGAGAARGERQLLLLDLSGERADDTARAGGKDLAEFYRGIDASRTTDPHLTALGHSCGSITTGFALQERTGVDDAVFFGSPGLGTYQVEDIQVPEGHTYRIEARNDFVADTAQFGIDPSHVDGVTGLSASRSPSW